MSEKILTADDILAANDLTIIKIEVPEWGGTVCFKTMPADEFIRFQQMADTPAKDSAWVKILSLCACDEKGNLLFTAQQLGMLKTKSTAVFLRLQKQLLALNGIEDKTKEAIKNA